MKKRILSILLLCCMVLTMLPTAAFAAGGAVRPAATQYTYTLHYDANGGSGAPPSQSVKSTNFMYGFPYQKKFQPVTDIPSWVGRILGLVSRYMAETAVIPSAW